MWSCVWVQTPWNAGHPAVLSSVVALRLARPRRGGTPWGPPGTPPENHGIPGTLGNHMAQPGPPTSAQQGQHVPSTHSCSGAGVAGDGLSSRLMTGSSQPCTGVLVGIAGLTALGGGGLPQGSRWETEEAVQPLLCCRTLAQHSVGGIPELRECWGPERPWG